MKQCLRCNEIKSLCSFPFYKAPVRRNICRKCVTSKRKSEGKCACGKPATKGLIRCDKCQEFHKKNAKKRAKTDKEAAFKHYGSSCVYCGETRFIFLSLDHINNDGAAHRKELAGQGSGSCIYAWVRKHNYPSILQTACFNCNFAKNTVGEKELIRVLKES